MQYIGFWRRFAAFIIDVIVLGIVQAPINMVFGTSSSQVVQQGSNVSTNVNSGISGVAALISLIISILYWIVLQHKLGGQTLGKKALGIKVIDAQGNVPSMMTLFLREVVGKMISSLILFIGFLMIIWDAKKQGLHDKIAGTFVIKA